MRTVKTLIFLSLALFFSVIGKAEVVKTVANTVEPSLSVSATALKVLSAANSSTTFTITSNTSWTITSDQSVCVASPASGSNNATITVTAITANTASTSRTANLTVAGVGVANIVIPATQAAAGATGSAVSLAVVSTAGGLSGAITAAGGNLSTIANLTVTGVIDARDFKILRSYMASLSVIDLTGVSIAAYTGIDGTVGSNTVFPINTIPQNALMPILPYTVNILTSVLLPTTITSIGNSAFGGLTGLTSIIIPSSVISIETGAFFGCSSLKTVYNLKDTPQALANQVFDAVNSITNVYVPTDGAVTAFRANAGWISYFPGTIIKKGGPSAFANVEDNQINISVSHSEIIVEGTSAGQMVSVYNLNGLQLHSVKSLGKSVSIPMKSPGVYIVKANNKAVKVVL